MSTSKRFMIGTVISDATNRGRAIKLGFGEYLSLEVDSINKVDDIAKAISAKSDNCSDAEKEQIILPLAEYLLPSTDLVSAVTEYGSAYIGNKDLELLIIDYKHSSVTDGECNAPIGVISEMLMAEDKLWYMCMMRYLGNNIKCQGMIVNDVPWVQYRYKFCGGSRWTDKGIQEALNYHESLNPSDSCEV